MMAEMPASRALVVAALACFTVACASEPAPQAEPIIPAGLGETCSAQAPCEASWVCLDGTCSEHPWPPDPEPYPPDVLTIPDISEPVPDPDADAGALADGDLVDGSLDGDILGEDALPSDAPPQDTPFDSGPDAGPQDTTPSGTLLYISADQADEAPGDSFVSLKVGQASAADLTAPLAGSVVMMEVVMADVLGPTSCGFFRPVIWVPDKLGVLPDDPTWQATGLQELAGEDIAQTFSVDPPAKVPAGWFRAGIVLAGTCPDDPALPSLYTDASGDTDGTWLWAPQGDSTPWVPGSFLGLDGRWALRVFLEVPSP